MSPKTSNRLLGDNIARIRKSLGISQDKLGEILGIHQSQVCRIEAGTQKISAYQVYKIRQFTGTPYSEVFKNLEVQCD